MFKGKTRPGDDHVQVIQSNIENFDGGFRNRENIVAEPQVRILRSGKMTCTQFVAACHNYLGNNTVVGNLPLKDAAKMVFDNFAKGEHFMFLKDLVKCIVEYTRGVNFKEDSCFAALAIRLKRIARPLGQKQILKNAFTMFDNGTLPTGCTRLRGIVGPPKGREKMSMHVTTNNRAVRDGLVNFDEFYHGLRNYVGNSDYVRAPKENIDHKDYLYEDEARKVWVLVRQMAGKAEGSEGKLTLDQVVNGLLWIQENLAPTACDGGGGGQGTDDEVQRLAREHLEAMKLALMVKIVRHGRQHSLNRTPHNAGQAELFEAVHAVEAMLRPFMRRRAERGQAVRHWDEWDDVTNAPRDITERHNKWRPSDRDGCINSDEFYLAVKSFLSAESVDRDMTDGIYADLDADSGGRGAMQVQDIAYKVCYRVISARQAGSGSGSGSSSSSSSGSHEGGAHGGGGKRASQAGYVYAPFGQTEQHDAVPTVFTAPARDRMRPEYWTNKKQLSANDLGSARPRWTVRPRGATGAYYLEGGADDVLRPVKEKTYAEADAESVAKVAEEQERRAWDGMSRAQRRASVAAGGVDYGSDAFGAGKGQGHIESRRNSKVLRATERKEQRAVLALSRHLYQMAVKAAAGTSDSLGVDFGGHSGQKPRGRAHAGHAHARVVAGLRGARGGRSEAWSAPSRRDGDGTDAEAAAEAAAGAAAAVQEAERDKIVTEWIWGKFANFGGSYFGHRRHGLYPEQATVQGLKGTGMDVVSQREGGGGGGGGADVGEFRYSEEHDGRAPRFTKLRFEQFHNAITAALGRPVSKDDARALFLASARREPRPNESGELEDRALIEIRKFGRDVVERREVEV
jgi:hypothetical protein